jgi:spoIIIJ-associated protein
MTFREFTGKNVEEAIRGAMKEFEAELGDLDIEILSQGSRGILGVGGEEARILAAPKSAVAAAETVRAAPPPSVGGEPALEAAVETDVADVPETPSDTVAEPARERRARGGGARGGRGANGRERDRGARGGRERGRTGARVERADRPPRVATADRPAREPAPFVPGKPIDELSDAERGTLTTAKEVLEEMLRLMGIEGTVEVVVGAETSKLNVSGSDLGVLIGRRGEKLAALQHLVNLVVAKREGQHHRIAIDVENYRGRREEQLRDVADRAAKRVIDSGKIIQLEAMPAMERRIVHLRLMENPKVRTQSVGVEPNRRIVVLPATQAEK